MAMYRVIALCVSFLLRMPGPVFTCKQIPNVAAQTRTHHRIALGYCVHRRGAGVGKPAIAKSPPHPPARHE